MIMNALTREYLTDLLYNSNVTYLISKLLHHRFGPTV